MPATGVTTQIVQPAERRQTARTLVFPAELTDYINWERIAQQRLALNCDMDTRIGDGGALVVTLFWRIRKVDC